MTGQGSISNNNNEINEIVQKIVSFRDTPLGKAVYHLHELGYSYRKIGEIIGWSHTSVENHFPKEAHA